MGFIKEFKEFAATGNFIDLAVGVVMGAAVGKVVSAFIDKELPKGEYAFILMSGAAMDGSYPVFAFAVE